MSDVTPLHAVRRPSDASQYPNLHTELPFGADVAISFEGRVVRTGDTSITLSTDAENRVTIDWSYPVDNSEEADPVVVVFDYGFKPGDVAVRAVPDHNGQWQTFFATTGSTDHQPIEWLDRDGVLNDVDPSTLTLVLRDGFPVTMDDE